MSLRIPSGIAPLWAVLEEKEQLMSGVSLIGTVYEIVMLKKWEEVWFLMKKVMYQTFEEGKDC